MTSRGLALAIAISGPPLLGAIATPPLAWVMETYGWRTGCVAFAGLMAVLGGRLGAYRDGFAGTGDFEEALVRNLYRGERPAPAQLAHVADELRRLRARLAETPLDALLAGRMPA